MPGLTQALKVIHYHPMYRLYVDEVGTDDRLCCTKRVRDSCRESSVVAGPHEQTDIPDLQDDELG